MIMSKNNITWKLHQHKTYSRQKYGGFHASSSLDSEIFDYINEKLLLDHNCAEDIAIPRVYYTPL